MERPNDLSIHMVWAHLMSDVEYQKMEKDRQNLFAVTVHGLLQEAGISINRDTVLFKYMEIIEA